MLHSFSGILVPSFSHALQSFSPSPSFHSSTSLPLWICIYQNGLKLTMQLRITLTSSASCLHLPSVGLQEVPARLVLRSSENSIQGLCLRGEHAASQVLPTPVDSGYFLGTVLSSACLCCLTNYQCFFSDIRPYNL